MNFKLPLILSAAAAALSSSLACAPYFAPPYLAPGNGYSVRLNHRAAFKRFVDMHRDLLPEPFAFSIGMKSKKDAHKADFTAALKRFFPKMAQAEQDKLLERYMDYLKLWEESSPFESLRYPELPEELVEFKLYLDGFDELHRNPELAMIPEAWQKLLKLPPERRHFRTAWVHFILGNHFKADCHTHYDNCRNAVRAGFADTQGVALRSYTLELRYGKNPVRMIRRAAEAELSNSPLDFLDTISPRWINELTDAQYIALLEDPLTREFLAITDLSPRFQRMITGYPLRSADIRACHAYEKGDIKLARAYISQLAKPTLLSVYIEAKLARHTGNTYLAAKKLRQWLDMAANASPVEKKSLVDVHDYDVKINTESDVYGLLGSALVFRHDFKEAAEFFYRAKAEFDLHRILEHFFTLDEAAEFVAKLKDSRFDKQLKYLVSRRAFRESRFDLAARYLPQEELPNLKNYIAFMEKANNTRLDGNSRAIAIYNAAKILRYHGMELAGTQEAPDFFPGGLGGVTPDDYCANSKKEDRCRYNKFLGQWSLCEEHVRWHRFRVPGFNAPKDHCTVNPFQRYHYRHKAAQLAVKAGHLAQDDDLRAIIYIFGGNCMRKTSPVEADIFYKMLVNECRGSLLSKLADRQRWFPTDNKIMNKEVNHSTPLKDMAAVKSLIDSVFHK